MPSQNSSGALILVRPNPNRFFGFNQILGPNFGFKWVGLTSKRVQIRVQPYNVLNKLISTQPVFNAGWALRFQNWVESGWVGPHGQNSGRVGWVHLAALINIVHTIFLMWRHCSDT